MSDWPTKESDLALAERVLYQYTEDLSTLSLFEYLKDEQENYRLCDWVEELNDCFCKLYGLKQGEYVTKKIISNLLINRENIH